MRKIISAVLALLLITALLASCGGQTPSTASVNSGSGGAYDAVAPEAAPAYSDGKGKTDSQTGNGDLAALTSGSALTSGVIGASLNGDKIIYNFSAQVETTAFDDTLKNLDALLAGFGAFVENSYVSGNSYGNTTFRSAEYTIRVPVGSFKGMTDALPLLGNVSKASTTSQNITAQFIDTQSRLDAYKTEESRLLAMLDKTTTVQDMITIESRLSDVRYQIESLTSTLQNWQNQVDFSTVALHISEVAEIKEQVSAQRTYWERMRDGISGTLNGIGTFFKSLFMAIVVALPVLIILAVLAAAALVIYRTVRKKRAKASQDIDKKE
ncbi:protein of unknown function [Sporobacter termitidis DSM 10068]|uniref:DUF4349 domain-containing protein n=1 Tax=Sporobacter termitidis DSM 10068 TaxID=1123282 RepID=A0A1M5YWZ4_9FIRM|nr:DUF4349 domain-containing protein [Sporobacter termitidis]SHI16083.1 protein of unknown function [Sporobacter termitidis DSM 10068]